MNNKRIYLDKHLFWYTEIYSNCFSLSQIFGYNFPNTTHEPFEQQSAEKIQ